MKNKRILFTSIAALLGAAPIQAADLTWNNGASTGNWNTTDLNWTGTLWNNATPDNAFFNASTGTINLTEAITAGNLTFGLTNANISGAFAGAALTVNGNLTAVADGANGPNGPLLSFSNNVTVAGDLAIGRRVVEITGGVFTANRLLSAGSWGRLLVSGGNVTMTNGIDDSINGGNTMNVVLNGGTLSTPYIKTTTVNFSDLNGDGVVLNGGTLRATASSTDFIQTHDPTNGGWGTRNHVGVGPNGANIDTNGFDIAINRHLVNYAGSGTLTKNGAGKLTLVWSEHNGGTTVNGGTLEYVANSGYSLLRNGLTVNAGGTVSVLGDGTGLGWQGGHMVTSLNINGGTVTSPGVMHIWNMGGGVNMTGGTLQSNGGVSNPNGSQLEWNNSTVTTNANATSATIAGRIRMRNDGGYSGITFNVADGAAATDLLVSAAITQASGGLGITKSGNGTMVLSGTNNYTGNTTINGGTLKIADGASIYNGGYNNSAVLAVNNGATLELSRWGYGPGGDNQSLGGLDYNPARFVINGGTVRFTGGAAGAPTNPSEAPYGPGFTIGALGATLDAAKVNDTWTVKYDSRGFAPIASNDGGTLTLTGIGNGVFDKELGGAGGVVKNGPGTWTLNRASTYTGATSVTAGGLDLTGSLTSNISVSGGGIGGEGITTGSLTFTGASTLSFDPTTGGFLRAATANATGATVTLVPTSGAASTGIVVLEALGGITGTAGTSGTNFIFAGRGTPYLNGTNTQLLFDFTPGSLVWKGNDGTNPTFWDVNATTNWTLGGSPDKFQVGDSVTFDDTATSFNVAVQGGSVTPGGVTFNNTTAYTVSGGAIAGGGGLTKDGAGIVTIKSAQTFTGATVINAGTVQLGDGTVGNDGSLTTSGITNNASLAYNLNGSQTASYGIGGTGSLTKSGNGTLTLSAANSYSGGTTVSGGILRTGNASALGASGAAISVAAGGTLDFNGQQLDGYTQNIQIAGSGADAAIGALGNSGGQNLNAVRGITLTGNASIGGNGGRWDIGRLDFNADPNNTVNHIDGGGFVLTKVGNSALGLLSGATNLAGFVLNAGTVIPHENTSFGAGPVTINAGVLNTWAGLTVANNFTLNGGTIGTDAGFNDTYTGSFAINGAATFNPGNGNITLSGPLSGAGAISKTGNSRLILSGNNTQTGTLTVNGGHVHFASASGNATHGSVELRSPGSFLLMNAPDQFGPNAGLLFNSSGGHNEFALYGHNQTIASLASTNGFSVVQNSHGAFGAASASATLTVNQSTNTTFNGVFRDNTGNDSFTLALVKTGSGTLTLATDTSHTGGTTVNGGVLEVVGSSGGNGYIRGTATVTAGGELRFSGGDGTGFGYNNGHRIDTLNIQGGLVHSTTGAHLFNGVNVNMQGGELRVTNGSIQWNYVTVNTSASASTALINGAINLRSDGGFSNSVFNVSDGTAATDLEVTGPISSSGSVGLTKNDPGTMTLTGANTYSGATTVNGGTLRVSGSISGSTTVNTDATLGGTGTVGAVAVNSGGTLAPGASIGTLNSGAVSLGAGSTFALEINTTATSTDLLAIAGGLSLADDDSTILTISDLAATPITTGTFTFITYNTGSWDGDLFTYGGNIIADGGSLMVGANEFTLDYDLGGNSVALVAVPEPGTAVSLLSGLGLLLGLRRRRA